MSLNVTYAILPVVKPSLQPPTTGKKLQLKLQVERRMLVKNKVSMKVVPLFVPENLSHHINCHSGSNNECTVPEEI